jgi:hypothetical protein
VRTERREQEKDNGHPEFDADFIADGALNTMGLLQSVNSPLKQQSGNDKGQSPMFVLENFRSEHRPNLPMKPCEQKAAFMAIF